MRKAEEYREKKRVKERGREVLNTLKKVTTYMYTYFSLNELLNHVIDFCLSHLAHNCTERATEYVILKTMLHAI